MLIYDCKALKAWYKASYDWIKLSVPLKVNKQTVGLYNDTWASEYRRIPIDKINGSLRPIVIGGE